MIRTILLIVVATIAIGIVGVVFLTLCHWIYWKISERFKK